MLLLQLTTTMGPEQSYLPLNKTPPLIIAYTERCFNLRAFTSDDSKHYSLSRSGCFNLCHSLYSGDIISITSEGNPGVKNNNIFIAVIGGSNCSSQAAALAEEAGGEIARHDAVLVCGGLGGVMEATCKGASREGGLTIGILPGDNRQAANPYVRIPIATGLGYARNVAVVKSAQAVIAIDGSYGTLSEIGHALQSGIPVIGLNTWSLSIDGQADNSIIPAKTPKDAVNKAIELINKQFPE
jgi:uncharacterized protein (TIGR00725 family)